MDREHGRQKPMGLPALDRIVAAGECDSAFRPASAEAALRDGPRQFFALAAEVARGQFDPAAQWGDFVQALWEQMDAGFGLSPDDEGYPGVRRAWFDEPHDSAVVVWDPRPDVG